jgi:amino acid permease
MGPFERPTPGGSASYRRWVRLALLAGFLAAMSVVALNYYARSGAEIIGQAQEEQPRPQSPVPAVSR